MHAGQVLYPRDTSPTCFSIFETGSHWVTQADFRFKSFLDSTRPALGDPEGCYLAREPEWWFVERSMLPVGGLFSQVEAYTAYTCDPNWLYKLLVVLYISRTITLLGFSCLE